MSEPLDALVRAHQIRAAQVLDEERYALLRTRMLGDPVFLDGLYRHMSKSAAYARMRDSARADADDRAALNEATATGYQE